MKVVTLIGTCGFLAMIIGFILSIIFPHLLWIAAAGLATMFISYVLVIFDEME